MSRLRPRKSRRPLPRRRHALAWAGPDASAPIARRSRMSSRRGRQVGRAHPAGRTCRVPHRRSAAVLVDEQFVDAAFAQQRAVEPRPGLGEHLVDAAPGRRTAPPDRPCRRDWAGITAFGAARAAVPPSASIVTGRRISTPHSASRIAASGDVSSRLSIDDAQRLPRGRTSRTVRRGLSSFTVPMPGEHGAQERPPAMGIAPPRRRDPLRTAVVERSLAVEACRHL